MTSDKVKRKREGGRGRTGRVSLLAALRFLFVRRWDMGIFFTFFHSFSYLLPYPESLLAFAL